MLQLVWLHPPNRWHFYTLSNGKGPKGFFWALMLGRIEVRLRWPVAPHFFVKEPTW
jgi:hypothetical protein